MWGQSRLEPSVAIIRQRKRIVKCSLFYFLRWPFGFLYNSLLVLFSSKVQSGQTIYKCAVIVEDSRVLLTECDMLPEPN